jgi:hypothetical protein
MELITPKYIKRFILRALLRLKGIPWPDALLEESVRNGIVPRPLLSDIHEAKRELEQTGYIQGNRDDLDGEVTWTLTAKGRHRAAELD